MSLLQLSTSLPAAGSPLSAVLLFLGTVGAAVLALYGVLYSQRAPQQQALNTAFRDFIQELQALHASDTARISELCREVEQYRVQLLERDARIRGLEQSRDSLIALIRRSGIVLPGEPSSEQAV